MAVTPILSYTSCSTQSCSATSIFEMVFDETTTLVVDTNTSTPNGNINTWRWDLVGVAVSDTDWVDSYIVFSGSSGTAVPVSSVMTGQPVDVTEQVDTPTFDLSSTGLTFNSYDVFALSLTVTTTDGCSSKSTITFDLAGNYYNYVLDYENTLASSTEETPCDCGCGCDCDAICDCVTLTDDTVYGSPNPVRSDCTVDFAIYMVDSNLVRTTIDVGDYDPTTVTAVSVDLSGDGWYEFVMTVTANDGSFEVNTVSNYMVKCAAEKAYNAVLANLQCGNNDNSVVLDLVHQSANLQQLNYKWCISDFQGAQRILECINALGTDCGCSDC